MKKITINNEEDLLIVSRILIKNGNEHKLYKDGIELIEHKDFEISLDETRFKPLKACFLGKDGGWITRGIIGDKFKYLSYSNQPIEWEIVQILDNDEIIMYSTKILETMAFREKFDNNYENSDLKKWCKKIGKNVFIPRAKQIKKWYPSENLRQCEGTTHAINNGLYVDSKIGKSRYWTSTPESLLDSYVYFVFTSGVFGYSRVLDSTVGVRPAIRMKLSEILKYGY